ncbi:MULTISPECIES: hypothetical protein [Achromobacter]|uniref:hypothetical protein n=1 Tax=Achromobacter TaxID=222 RepID=UPI0006C833AB|nr:MULTISPECIES: hypothetical protein [Achromobacter]
MTISVEQFIEQTPAKRGRRRSSKVWMHMEEVTELKQRGYSYDQIKDFLAKNGVEVKRSTLISFVRRAEQRAQREAEEKARSGTAVGIATESAIPEAKPVSKALPQQGKRGPTRRQS